MAKAPKTTKALTKSALTAHLAETAQVPKKTVQAILDELTQVAYREAKKEAGFVMPGLGKLVVVKTKARVGRHPQTGAELKIPAKKRLKFRIAKQAKDAIVGAQK